MKIFGALSIFRELLMNILAKLNNLLIKIKITRQYPSRNIRNPLQSPYIFPLRFLRNTGNASKS